MTAIPGTNFVPGPHVIAISVTVELSVTAPEDDDDTDHDLLLVDFGPIWRPDTFLQATSMVSWGEIESRDSDEVDHTTFGLRVFTGHRDFVDGGAAVRQLRVRIDTATQGEQNEWKRIGFQTIANGTLLDPSTTPINTTTQLD